MSSVWNFFVRNRRKLAVGGIAVGAAYLLQKYLRSLQTENPRRQGMTESDSRSLMTRSRKHFIFDSNQLTCDNAVLMVLPRLLEMLREKFDIDAATERIRVGTEDKLVLWNQMKSDCVTRLLSLVYTYTLVTITMKAQINILAQRIWLHATDQQQQQSQASMTTVLSGILNSTPLSGLSSSFSGSRREPIDEDTHHLFLQSIQYFLRVGVTKLVERIEGFCNTRMSRLNLKDSISLEQLAELFSEIRAEIESSDCRMFTYFIVPLSADKDAFGLGNPQLEHLLVELRQVLESDECREYFTKAIDQWLRTLMELCHRGNREGFQDAKGLPVAKLIPILSDCFSGLGATEADSPVGIMLKSDELRQFCVGVFENSSRQHHPHFIGQR